MTERTTFPRTPVEIARMALRNIAELGVQPTPENYAEQYCRAAGLPVVEASSTGSSFRGLEMEAMLRGIVELIAETATGLSGGVSKFHVEIGGMIERIEEAKSGDSLRALMQALMVSALALQNAADASRTELSKTQEQLVKVSIELERTHEQARTDPLTGFINRRGMNEVLAREIARARRVSTPLCIAILDIDHFKKINDCHGHSVGDRALIHLARLTGAAVRETDIVCRYGGEEFVVVLPGAALDGARFVIDRLRFLAEKTPLHHGQFAIDVRFSAGIAELVRNEMQEALLSRADKALYHAKRAGRNRVEVAILD